MNVETWLAFAVAASVVLVVPGPTVLLVTGFALRHGTAAAMRTVSGVVAGHALAMTLSLVGVGALLAASATLFAALKLLGAAYLIWLGIRPWRARVPERGLDLPLVDGSGLKWQAFTVTALNPKGIVFFVAFMPQFVSTTAPVLPQLLLLGVTFLVLASFNASLYVLLVGSVQERPRERRTLVWANRLGGSFLIGAGVLTATLRGAV